MNRRSFLATAASVAPVAALPLVPAMAAAEATAALDPLAGIPHEELPCGSRVFRLIRFKWEDTERAWDALSGIVRGMGEVIRSSRPPEHPRHPGLFAHSLSYACEGMPESFVEHPDERGILRKYLVVGEPTHVLFKITYARPEFIPGMTA